MSNADKITDFAIGKLNAIFDGVQHAMPTVTKYALEVTSMGCLVNVLHAISFTIITGVMILIDIKLWKWAIKGDFDNPVPVLGGIFFGIGCLLMAVLSITYLFDFWQWIGIFHPDLYLIHMALQKVTG